MDVKSADFLSLSSDDSAEVDERLMDVQTILCCLQSLTDHIASLENKHIATNRLHKNNEVTLIFRLTFRIVKYSIQMRVVPFHCADKCRKPIYG